MDLNKKKKTLNKQNTPKESFTRKFSFYIKNESKNDNEFDLITKNDYIYNLKYAKKNYLHEKEKRKDINQQIYEQKNKFSVSPISQNSNFTQNKKPYISFYPMNDISNNGGYNSPINKLSNVDLTFNLIEVNRLNQSNSNKSNNRKFSDLAKTLHAMRCCNSPNSPGNLTSKNKNVLNNKRFSYKKETISFNNNSSNDIYLNTFKKNDFKNYKNNLVIKTNNNNINLLDKSEYLSEEKNSRFNYYLNNKINKVLNISGREFLKNKIPITGKSNESHKRNIKSDLISYNKETNNSNDESEEVISLKRININDKMVLSGNRNYFEQKNDLQKNYKNEIKNNNLKVNTCKFIQNKDKIDYLMTKSEFCPKNYNTKFGNTDSNFYKPRNIEILKHYSSSKDFLNNDKLNNKNITVKRNVFLKQNEEINLSEKDIKINRSNSNNNLNIVFNNIHKVNTNKNKINNNNIIYSKMTKSETLKNLMRSSNIIKNKIVKKIYIKPEKNSINTQSVPNLIKTFNNLISNNIINMNIKNISSNNNQIKSPETQKIYQKQKNPYLNIKKQQPFGVKNKTPEKMDQTKKVIKTSNNNLKFNKNNNSKFINNNLKENSSGTDDYFIYENKNDFDSNKEYLSRLNYLKENLSYFMDKVINKKQHFITKYYDFYLDKQLITNKCYFTKKYFPIIRIPKINNCLFTKNNEILYKIYTFKNSECICYYTKNRKLIIPILKMPIDTICVYEKNIIYDRFKKKQKTFTNANSNSDILNENNIKPQKNKKRRKRRKTRKLHKMTQKELEEQKLKNEKAMTSDEYISADDIDNITSPNNNNILIINSNISKNENEKFSSSKSEIKSNILTDQKNNSNNNNNKINSTNNKSKYKSPIYQKTDNQSSILSETEINLANLGKESQNQIKSPDTGFFYEDGYKENEDFHIDSDEDEDDISKKNIGKNKNLEVKKNLAENNFNKKETIGKEVDDSEISKYTPQKNKNFRISSNENSQRRGYQALRQQKILKILENIQRKKDKIAKLRNYNIANQKILLATNKLNEILINAHGKKQKIELAINKLEKIIGRKKYKNENEIQENEKEDKNDKNYKDIFELNPIKKLELIMNKQSNIDIIPENISKNKSENNIIENFENNNISSSNNQLSTENNITNSEKLNLNSDNNNFNNYNSFTFHNTITTPSKKYSYNEILFLRDNKYCLDNNLLSINVIKHCTEILKEIKNFSTTFSTTFNSNSNYSNSLNRKNCSTDNLSMTQWARKDLTKEINQAEQYVKDLNKNLSKDVLKHKIIEILNTITVDNYKNILKKLIEMIFINDKENKTKLMKPEYLLHNQCIFAEIIIDKATIEKSYVILYAKLCADLYTELLKLINDYKNHEIKNQLINGENLKTIIIGECQQRFDECTSATLLNIKNNENLTMLNENYTLFKKKFLGNMNFIAELINVKIISQTLGFNFLNILYKRYKEITENDKIKFLNLEGAVILLGKFGKIVCDRQNPKHMQNLDNFINDKIYPILEKSEENNLPNYLKYKIINLIEKKKNNWKDSLYENSINAKGKYSNFLGDEDIEENGDKIIIDESFDGCGFNKENGLIGNEDEEKTKENNIIILIKEDIENYITFLNENNIFNKKDLEEYFNENDNYDLNNDYNWSVINEMVINLKIELEEIIRCYIEVCIDYVTKHNIIFYVNEYIRNIINYYGADLSKNDLNRFHLAMVNLFLNVDDVCVDNVYMWEIMGFLLSLLIIGKLYYVKDLNGFLEKDKCTQINIANMIKYAIIYYDGNYNEFIKQIKEVDIFKKNKDLFMENIIKPLKKECEI